ncbi:hypothetical protein HYV43_02890 [Candidatus Micrarchaeota archaeon]|nr:hypothetical protein [Candidatus Micrarchaeota archaeon]
MDLFQSIILAAIQGTSAWIPISSKTQVILAADALFRIPFQTAVAFALALHVGDLLAALYKYQDEYADAFLQLFQPRNLARFQTEERMQDARFLVLSVLASAAVGLPVYLLLRKIFTNVSGEPLLFFVGIFLIGMAALTWHSRRKTVVEKPLDLTTTLITGAAQGLAVLPGISRSGITQCTLLLQGVPQERAMRLSFLMSAPMIAASVVAFQLVEGFGGLDPALVLAGIAVSAIASLLTMDAITKIARKVPSWQFMAAIGALALVPFVLKITMSPTG